MPETINLFRNESVAVGSNAARAFTVPHHDGLVSFNIQATRVGTGYRVMIFTIDGQQLTRWFTGMNQNKTITADVPTGEHVFVVEVNPSPKAPYGTGPYVFTINATYAPAAPPAAPELPTLPEPEAPLPTGEEMDIMPLIIGGVLVVIGTAGAWFLTAGFTKLPAIPTFTLPF